MEKEYQLCLKEMNYEEKLKKLTEKFNQQMDSITKQNQVRSSAFINISSTYIFQISVNLKFQSWSVSVFNLNNEVKKNRYILMTDGE